MKIASLNISVKLLLVLVLCFLAGIQLSRLSQLTLADTSIENPTQTAAPAVATSASVSPAAAHVASTPVPALGVKFTNTTPTNLQQVELSSSLIEEKEEEFQITLIAVMSMQRSASTFLAETLMKLNKNITNEGGELAPLLDTCPWHHFLAMNEVFKPDLKQSGKTWFTGKGREALLRQHDGQGNYTSIYDMPLIERRRRVKNISGQELGEVIREEASKRCRWKIENSPFKIDTANGTDFLDGFYPGGKKAPPRHHCFISYKHFNDDLLKDQIMQLWRSLSQNLKLVVLERDVVQRWRSWSFAQKTGDWNTHGATEHKKQVAEATVMEVSDKFKKQHWSWYELLRSMLQGPDGVFANISSVFVTYKEVTHNQTEARRKIFDAIFPWMTPKHHC